MKNARKMFALMLVLCMVLPMCLLTVYAEETVVYKFYCEGLDYANKGRTTVAPADAANQAVLDAAWANGTINFMPLTYNSAKDSKPTLFSLDAYPDAAAKFTGLKVQSETVGDWYAIRIKNPGNGYFNIDINAASFGGNVRGAKVYILPGNTDASAIGQAMTVDNLYGEVDLRGNTTKKTEAVPLSKTLESKTSDGDYIVVFQSTKPTSTASGAAAHFYIEGLTLTKTDKPSSGTVPTKPTTATNPTTATKPPVSDGTIDDSGYKTFHSTLTGLTYTDKGIADLKNQMETMTGLYNAGSMKMIPYAWNSAKAPYIHYQAADTSNNFAFNGFYLQKGSVGDWVAFKFKSPGEGFYSLTADIWYNNDNNALKLDGYLLPGNTAAGVVGSLLTDENKIGSGVILGETQDKTDVALTLTTKAEFAANKEYILVLKVTEDLHNPIDDRIDLFVPGITIGEGREPLPGAFEPIYGDTVLTAPIKYAEVYRSFSGTHPVNGHDLLYLAFKGGTMLVYDVDEKKVVDEVTGMSSVPYDACFDPEGNIWVAGSGPNLYKYNPVTKEGKRVNFQKFDGTSRNTYGVVYGDDGYIYFTSWGFIGRMDPRTGETINLSGTQISSDPNKKSDAQFAAYGGMFYKDGYLYFGTYGDLNADLEYTSEFIKYDIANRKVVQAIDIRDATHGSTKFGYGINFVSRVGDLLIGGFSSRPDQRVIVDISGDEMVRLDTIGDFDSHFIGRVSEGINGKYYFTAYVDNESSVKAIHEYDSATNTVTRLGDIVYISSMGTKYATATIDGLPGVSILAPFSNSATGQVDLCIYNIETRESVIWDSISAGYGSPVDLTALTTDSDGKILYFGGWGNNQLGIYNTETGELTVRSGYDHQTDDLIWYEDMLWIGNYNHGCITRYDPNEDELLPLFDLMGSVFQNKRMLSMAAGGGKVFCGTVPDTGRYGGVLVWYDIDADLTYVAAGPNPEDVFYADTTSSFVIWRSAVTHQVETFDVDGDSLYDYDLLVDDKGTEDPDDDVYKQRYYGVVENRVMANIIYKDGYIYGTTTKWNGQNIDATYTEGNAEIFVYDVCAMKLVATCDVADYIQGLENPSTNSIEIVDFILPDPYEDGKFWSMVCDTLFSVWFDHATGTFTIQEELSFGKGREYDFAGSKWTGHRAFFEGDYLYVNTHHYGLQMVNIKNPQISYQVAPYHAIRMTRNADGDIYYYSDQDGERDDLRILRSAQYTQPIVITSVQAAIDALPDTVTMDNEAQVLAVYRMYMGLVESTKAQINTQKLDTALEALVVQLAAKADSMIGAIGAVTLDSERSILTARDYYDALPDSAKEKTTKLSELEAAEAALAEAKQNAYKNPPKAQDNTPQPQNNNSVGLVIAIVAAAVVAVAAVVVLELVRKKKPEAEASNEEDAADKNTEE